MYSSIIEYKHRGIDHKVEDKLEALRKRYRGRSNGSGYGFIAQTRDAEYSFKSKKDRDAFNTQVLKELKKLKIMVSINEG